MYRVLLPSPRQPWTAWRIARVVGSFVVTFLAALWISSATRPDETSDQLGVKLTALAEADPPFNAVFVGSSRVYRGFVPSVFDRAMTDAGTPMRTMNLGNPGMRLPEFTLALEAIAKIPDHGLRWIFLDPEEPDSRLINEGNPRASRIVAWHNAERTLAVSRLVLETSYLDRREKLDRLYTQAQSFAYYTTGIGSAQPWLEDLLGTTPTWALESLGPLGDGYLPHFGFAPQAKRVSEKKADMVWAQRLRARAKTNFKKGRLEGPRIALYEEMIAAAQKIDATLVFVTLPGLVSRHDTARAAIQLRVPHLRFDLPEKRPELYLRKDRFDRIHLNHSGALAFTRAFAKRFGKFLVHARARGLEDS